MERALYTELGTIGSFSVCKTYDDAPNPSLRIQDVGIVGVPLSTRDAEAIKAKAEQAPFGVRERTIIDTDVRDTWEIDASTVNHLVVQHVRKYLILIPLGQNRCSRRTRDGNLS